MNNTDNIRTDSLPNCDLERMSQVLAYNKTALFHFLQLFDSSLLDYVSVSPNIDTSGQIQFCGFEKSTANAHMLANCRGSMSQSQVDEILRILRQGRKKDDPVSMIQFCEQVNNVSTLVLREVLYLSMRCNPISKQKEMIGFMNRSELLRRSRVEIEVFKRGIEQKNNRDQYLYYIAFKNPKNRERKIIRFTHHPSAAIYVMHLVDLIKRKDSRPINISKNLDKLQYIYHKLFVGVNPIKGIDPFNKKEKCRLNEYYSDIQNTLEENISAWDYVWPYCCNAESHIMLDPTSITIDKDLIPETWNINL